MDRQRFQLWMTAINGIVNVLRAAVIAVAVVAVAYYASRVFIAFAGKKTDALIGIQLITSIKLDRWVAYIVAIMGGTYGLRQRHLRRTSIERTTKRPIELEQRMDPNRTSSGITPRGTTRKEDL